MGENAALVTRVALAVLIGGWIALAQVTLPPPLGFATIAAVGFVAAGCALERRPRATGVRDFTVCAGVLIGLTGAALVSGLVVLAGIVAFGVMISYARVVGRFGVVVRAVLAGLPLMFGALAVNRGTEGVIPWTLAAWVQLVREQVAVLDPAAPSPQRRHAVIAVLFALGFVPVSLALPFRAGYGGAYFLVAMFAQLALLVAAARLVVGRMDGVSALVKGAMVINVLALLAGRAI